MHAGLIPILSRETGVDLPAGTGFILPENSVDAIQAAVRRLAGLPTEELRERARATWTHARERYSREAFIAAHRRAISQVVAVDVPAAARLGLKQAQSPA